MAVSKLFSKDTKYISRKRMRENYQHDPALREIMRDPVIAKVLDRPGEQKRFHDLLREKARDGKVDIHDMRKIADELAHGRVKNISDAEGRSIARAFFPDSSRRYEHDDPEPEKSSDDTSKLEKTKSNSQADSVGKSNRVSPAFFAYRAKSARTSSDSEKPESKKASYYDAMRSVGRNKKS